MSTVDHAAPQPTPGPPGTVPWLLHHLAVWMTRADLAIREKLGVNATDYLALKHLMSSEDPIGPVGLGRLLGISSGSATGLVDRLERDGRVERRPHPNDRRRLTLAVSASTAEVIAAEFRPLADEIFMLESSFSAEERAAIARFLLGLVDIHRQMYS